MADSLACLVAIAFGGGDVVFDGAWDGSPLGVYQAHDMVTQLGAGPIQNAVQGLPPRNDHTQLGYVCHIVELLPAALQLPVQSVISVSLGLFQVMTPAVRRQFRYARGSRLAS